MLGKIATRVCLSIGSWTKIAGKRTLQRTPPCGAGLAVHKSVTAKYLQYEDDAPLILDRSGHSLLSGGDNDLRIAQFLVDLDGCF